MLILKSGRTSAVKERRILEYTEIMGPLLAQPMVQRLKEFPHHRMGDRFSHSVYVSYISYWICKKMGLDCVSAARGGLLHDLYLYNSRDAETMLIHMRSHSKKALENAERLCRLNDIERDIILRHMWPITAKRPKYAESYVVSTVDKYCSGAERFGNRFRKKRVGVIEGAINM